MGAKRGPKKRKSRVILDSPGIDSFSFKGRVWAWAINDHRSTRIVKLHVTEIQYESPGACLLHSRHRRQAGEVFSHKEFRGKETGSQRQQHSCWI